MSRRLASRKATNDPTRDVLSQLEQARTRGAEREEDHHAALLDQIHGRLGNTWVSGLLDVGPTGGPDVYLHHLIALSQETGLDFGPYLPWNAPVSWSLGILPYFDVLWMEGQRAESAGGAATGMEGALASRRARTPVSDASTLAVDSVIGTGGGRPLTEREQAFLARVHGRTLPSIRVHEGPQAARAARAIDARAFTVGRDIYVAESISLDRPAGAELLAHEATHVLQDLEGRLPRATGPGLSVSSPSDPHEREAEQLGKEGARLAGSVSASDPWGLGDGAELDTAGRMIVDRLRGELPAAPGPEHETLLQRGEVAARAGGVDAGAPGADGGAGADAMLHRDTTQPAPAATQGQRGPQTWRVGAEVYARVEADRWRRGVILEVREPEEEEEGEGESEQAWWQAGTDETSEANDGWEYVVSFEEDEGTSEQPLTSDKLHDADEQTTPGPTLPGPVDEETPPDETLAEPQVCEGEPVAIDEAPADEEAAPVSLVAPPVTDAPAPSASVVTAPLFTPLVAPPMSRLPTMLDVDTPAAPDTGISPVQDAYYEQLTGVSVRDNIDEVNQSVDELVCTVQDEMASVADVTTQTVAQSSDAAATIQTDLSTTMTGLQSGIDEARITASQGTQTAADQGVQQIDQAAATTLATIDDLTETQRQALVQNAQTLEAEVQQRQADYATQIDTFITTEAGALRDRLNGVIGVLEREAAAEEQEAIARGQAFAGSYGEAAAAAEEIAKTMARSRVKKRYATALHRIADAAVQELEAQRGDPSRLIAGELHAPTIADLWPAQQHYEREATAQRDRTQAEATAAQQEFGQITQRAATQQTQQADQAQTLAQQTLQSADQTAQQSVDASQQETQRQQQDAAGMAAQQRQEQIAALQQAMGAGTQGGGPQASAWGEYVQRYQEQLRQEEEQVRTALADHGQQRTDEVRAAGDQTREEARTAADQVTQSVADDTQTFVQGVQESATATNIGLQSMATVTAETGEQLFATAQQRGEEALELLQSDGETFFENRIRENVAVYGQQADVQLAEMTTRMTEAIRTAENGAAEEERANRRTRERDCWGGIDYTWGTDEERLMKGVSGVTKVQGYALQHEYQAQHGSTLREDIIDDTSGALKRSLLAWIEGDEQTAVTEAMNYAATESFWGADTATAEVALRGLSQQGREALRGDPAFEAARGRLLMMTAMDTFSGQADYDAISVLSDTSMSKESAERMGDAIRLEDTMDHLGTNEAGAYDILGRRDQAGNQQLAADYAQYYYTRYLASQNDGKSWEELSDEERRYYEQNLLRNRISGGNLGLQGGPAQYDDGEFSGVEEDRALALMSGNRGAAAAAQLEEAASWSNDVEGARTALDSLNEGRGAYNSQTGQGDWLSQATYSERRAEFQDTVHSYQTDELSAAERRQRIVGHGTREHRQEVADNWDRNAASTRDYIADEYGDGETTLDTDASRRDRGHGNDDEVTERMLLDTFDRGQADASDLMARGVDTTGTREVFVKAALDGIAAESDANVRLRRLNSLGAYCWTFFEREVAIAERQEPGLRARLVQTATGRMRQLPAYVNELEGQYEGLRNNIKGVMIVLDWETDGGEQFDFELLVVQATARTDNVNDTYTLAQARFRSQLDDGDLDDYDDAAAVNAFVAMTPDQRTALLARQRSLSDDQVAGERNQHALSADDQLRAHFRILTNLWNAGKNVWFEERTGWLKLAPGQTEPSEEVNRKWREFTQACERVDLARQDVNAHNEQLIAAITMVVGIIAAIAIAVVSLGSATAASAGLLAATISLAAGAITFGAKLAILGDRYGAESMIADIGQALAEAAVNVLTLGMGKFTGLAKILDEAVGNASLFMRFLAEAGKALPGELMGVLTNEQLWDAGSYDMMATQLLLGLFGNAAGSTFSNRIQALAKIQDSQRSVDRLLQQLLDNMLPVLADPRQWESPDFGWQLLQAAGTGLAAGSIANGIRAHMLRGINSKVADGRSTMTAADWQRLAGLPAEHQQWFLQNLDPVHAQGLQTADPSLHARLFPSGTPPAPTPTPAPDQDANPTPTPEPTPEPAPTRTEDAPTQADDAPAQDTGPTEDRTPTRTTDPVVGDTPAVPPPAAPQQRPIDINTATLAELQQLDLIGPARAQAIIDYRNQHGPFRSVADLDNVPGIGEGIIGRNRERIAVGAGSPTPDVTTPRTDPTPTVDGGVHPTDDGAVRATEDPNVRPDGPAQDGPTPDGPTPHVDAPTDGTPPPSQEEVARLASQLAARTQEGGQGAVVDYVRGSPDPVEQQRRMQLMSDYERIMRVDPRDMTPAQRDLVLRAHSELNRGFDAATTMRKVIPADGMRALLDGSRSPHVGGSVGDARNTEGLTPAQMIERLGLDYTDSSGARPYLQGDAATGFRPIDEVIFMDMPITQDMRQRAQVPMDATLIEHARTSTDPEVRRLYDEGRLMGGEWQDVRRDATTGERDMTNPYTGTGGTAASSEMLPNAPVRANQELQIRTDRAAGNHGADIPPGTEIKYRGPDGQDVVVARFQGLDEQGRPRWVVNQDLPPALRTRLLGEAARDPANPIDPAHGTEAGDTNVRTPPPDPAQPGLDAQGRPSTGDQGPEGAGVDDGSRGSTERTEAGFIDRMRRFLGMAPPPTPGPVKKEHVQALFPDETVHVAHGPAVGITRANDQVILTVPPGHTVEQARAEIQRILGAERQRILQVAGPELTRTVNLARTAGDEIVYFRHTDGTVTLRVPYGFDLNQVGPTLAAMQRDAQIRLNGTTDVRAIQNRENVVVGAPFADVAAGHAMLTRLTLGDPTALAALGVPTLPATVTQGGQQRAIHEIEWGLGQLPDGRVVVIRGGTGAVDWGGFPDLIALAHSHPTRNAMTNGPKTLDTSVGGTVDQLLRGSMQNAAALLPSPSDLRYVDARGIENHVVHTPYRYDASTGQLDAGFNRQLPTVQIVILRTIRSPGGGLQAVIEMRAGSTTVWSGTIQATGMGCCMPAVQGTP